MKKDKRFRALLLLIGIFLIAIFISYKACHKTKAVEQADPDMLGYIHPIYSPTKFKTLTSVNMTRYRGRDTFLITGNTNSWLLNQDSGESWEHPLCFINATKKKIIIQGGVQSENCMYIKILGQGSTDAYGFTFVGGGVAGSFGGMYIGLDIESCRFTHGSQGSLWIKEEAPHACDFYNYWKDKGTVDSLKYGVIANYLAPNYQDSVWVQHCWIDSSGGDGYFGSTGTIKGRDVVPCLNNTTPPTMQTRNFHINYNYINYLGRSGLQLSLAVGGTNEIIGNVITNCGYEYAEAHSADSKNQGAGIRVGSGDVNVEVAHNKVKYTNLYNYDIGEGYVNFHDNTGDSVSYVVYHGVPYYGQQTLPSTIIHADNPQKGVFKMSNNVMTHTTANANIGFAIYGGSNFKLTNDTCNNTGSQVSVLSTPFLAQPCSSGGKPHDSTYSIIHDTPVVKHYPPVIGKIFDSTGYDTTAVGYIKLNGKRVYRVVGKYRNYSLVDTISGGKDSVIIIKTPPHDTTVRL